MPELALPHIQPETFRGQPCLRLRALNGDSALVALHGAQVLSWVANGTERLYLSPQAVVDGQAAIRGGVPVCFPQFNQRGPLVKHGFARHLAWQPGAASFEAAQQSTRLVLELFDSEQTHAWWPHGFAAQLELMVSPAQLHIGFSAHNRGSTAWSFTAALHTYLRVQDIAQARLEGLDACERWDALTDTRGPQQGPIRFAGEYDSVFQAAPQPLVLREDTGPVDGLEIEQSESFGNTVVWNPGAERCAHLADMPPEGYAQMLCVEAAQVDTPVHLPPGATWSGWQRLRVRAAIN